MKFICTYPAIFKKENDSWSVVFVDFDLATCGDDEQDAIRMAHEALAGYLYDFRDLDDSKLPVSSTIGEIHLKTDETVHFISVDPERDFDDVIDFESEDDIAVIFIPAQKVALARRKGINLKKVILQALDDNLITDEEDLLCTK